MWALLLQALAWAFKLFSPQTSSPVAEGEKLGASSEVVSEQTKELSDDKKASAAVAGIERTDAQPSGLRNAEAADPYNLDK